MKGEKKQCFGYAVAFYWNGWGLLVSLDGRHCKSIHSTYSQIDHLYPMMNHFYFYSEERWPWHHSQGTRAHWTVWWDENDIHHILQPSHWSADQAQGGGGGCIRQHSPPHHQTPWRSMFWKHGVYGSKTVSETVESMTRCIEVLLVSRGGFSFILLLICI